MDYKYVISGFFILSSSSLSGCAGPAQQQAPGLEEGIVDVKLSAGGKYEKEKYGFLKDACDRGNPWACYEGCLAFASAATAAADLCSCLQGACAKGWKAACPEHENICLKASKDAKPAAGLASVQRELEMLSLALNVNAFIDAGGEAKARPEHIVSLKEAKSKFEGECAAGLMDACEATGLFYEFGVFAPKDDTEAGKRYETAAAGGYPKGYSALGDLLYSDKEETTKTAAIEAFKKACSGGDAYGCARLGDLSYSGKAGGGDAAAALEFFQNACDGGNAKGCFTLSTMLGKGDGGRKDAKAAREAREKACALGDERACK